MMTNSPESEEGGKEREREMREDDGYHASSASFSPSHLLRSSTKVGTILILELLCSRKYQNITRSWVKLAHCSGLPKSRIAFNAINTLPSIQ